MVRTYLLIAALCSLCYGSSSAVADDGMDYPMRPRVVDERGIWPMPQFVQDKMQPMVIGVPITLKQISGCLKQDDAEAITSLHVNDSYNVASAQFGRLIEEDKCGVMTGTFYPHRVTWHHDLPQSILKVVEASFVDDEGKIHVERKVYIITEREVVGSGLREPVVGERGA